MPSDNYRYYRLDGAGHPQDAEWIQAQSDKDAIEQVEVRHPGATWELWHGTRMVAKVWPNRLWA